MAQVPKYTRVGEGTGEGGRRDTSEQVRREEGKRGEGAAAAVGMEVAALHGAGGRRLGGCSAVGCRCRFSRLKLVEVSQLS